MTPKLLLQFVVSHMPAPRAKPHIRMKSSGLTLHENHYHKQIRVAISRTVDLEDVSTRGPMGAMEELLRKRKPQPEIPRRFLVLLFYEVCRLQQQLRAYYHARGAVLTEPAFVPPSKLRGE